MKLQYILELCRSSFQFDFATRGRQTAWINILTSTMKVLIILSGILAVSLAQQNNEEYVKQYLVGNWKENQYQRTNLNNFLYEMGKNLSHVFTSLLNRNSVVRISAVRGPSDKIEVSAGRSWPQDEHLMCTFWIPEPAGPEIRKNWKNVLPFTSSIQKRKTLKKLFNWTFLRTSKTFVLWTFAFWTFALGTFVFGTFVLGACAL